MSLTLSSLNPLSVVSNVAESLVESIVPGQAGEILGDIASGVADFYTGNYVGMIEDGLDLLGSFGKAGTRPDAPPTGGTPTSGTSDSGNTDGAKADEAKTDEAKTDENKKAADKAAIDKFFTMSDQDMLNALKNGTVPDSVLSDKGAMLRLQTRVADFQEMMKLMSQMISAMHEMNMSVIGNVRA